MKKRVRYAAKWIFHYAITPLVPHIPFGMLRWLAAVLGSLNYLVNTEIRSHITRNLKEVFPDKNETEIRNICRRDFVNHAMHSLEILYLPSVNAEFVHRHITIQGFEHVKEALQRGNGIIFILGHVGFYYLSGVATQLLGVTMNDISQDVSKLKMNPIDQRILAKRLQSYEKHIGGKVFQRGGSLLGVVKAIKRNEAISLFIDALTTEKDPTAYFLGRRTRVPQGPIRMAMQTGATIIFSKAIHEADGTLVLAFQPVPLDLTNDRERDLQINAQKFMDLLTPVIIERPDQWHLWRTFHERCFREDATAGEHAQSYGSGAGRSYDGTHSPMG